MGKVAIGTAGWMHKKEAEELDERCTKSDKKSDPHLKAKLSIFLSGE